MDDGSQRPRLKKAITLRYAVALYVSSVLGSGILVIPGLAARIAGSASIIGWILLAVLSYPFAYTFASLSSRKPESGGVYSFAKEGLGKTSANIAAWLFSTWYMTGAPAATLIGTYYLEYAFHFGKFFIFMIAAVLIFVSYVINYLGITLTGKVQLSVTICIIGLLIIATSASIPSIRIDNLKLIAPFNLLSLGTASALIVWSYFGYENVSNVAEEFREPKKDFHRSVALSVLISSSLYIAIAVAIIGTGSISKGAGIAPFAAIMSNGFGEYAGMLTSLVALFIVFGNMNAYTTGISRVVYAASKDGLLPQRLSKINAKYKSPERGLGMICFGAIIVLLIYYMLNITLQDALLLSNGIGLCIYIIGSASGIKLLKKEGVSRFYPWFSLFLSLALVPFIGVYSLLVIVCVILTSVLYMKHASNHSY